MLRKHIEKTLKRMQRDAYYTRGKDYFDSGAVIDLQKWEGSITAQVMGTHLYTVEFSEEDDEFFMTATVRWARRWSSASTVY
jgi:uncharacterized Zn finger protein